MLLAGGAGSRFPGSPKGLALLGGERIADRVLRALRPATDRLLVVANDSRAGQWFPGLTLCADDTPGLGPLAGIATALRAAGGAPVLLVAWDMPFVTSELLRAIRAHGGPGTSAVIPRQGRPPVLEPLCAWYSPAVLDAALALLATGERSARALAGVLPGCVILDEAQLEPLGDPSRLFTSVDTPEALARLQAQSHD